MPLAVVFVLLLGLWIYALYRIEYNEIGRSTQRRAERVEKLFQMEQVDDAKTLHAVVDLLQYDKELQSLWLAKDRDALFKYVELFFHELRSRYRVTHFAFCDIDRTCFLRVHKPERYGDEIKRYTMLQAQEKYTNTEGMELGALGMFTLRIVHPWMIDGKLAGYIELGEEIERITQKLHDIVDVNLLVMIDKSYLDRSGWEEGMKTMGRDANWDQFADHVLVDSTMENVPWQLRDEIYHHITRGNGQNNMQFLSKDKTYEIHFIKLTDAGGNNVGNMASICDITAEVAALKSFSVILISASTALVVCIIGMFYIYLGRIGKELVESREEIVTEEENLEKIFNAAPVGMLLLDEHANVLQINDVVKKMVSMDTVIDGTQQPGNILCCIHSVEDPKGCGYGETCANCPFRQTIMKVIKEGHSFHDVEILAKLTLDGKEVSCWLSVSAEPVNMNGKRRVVVAMNNITARKQAEQQLIEAMEHSELLYRVVPSGIFTMDKDGMITSCNETFEEITGFKEIELLGKKCSEFALEPCSHGCDLFSDDTPKPITAREAQIQRKDGTIVNILKNADLLRDEAGNVIGGIESFEDITEVKKAQDRAREAVEAKSRFVSTASHELRTPLTAIKEGINLVYSGMTGELNDEQKEFLEIAKRNVDRLARLINNVLDFQKISAGRMNFVIKPNNINEVVKQIEETMQPWVRDKGLKLEVELDEHIEEFGFDSDKIIQVLTNLVNNAIKFTDHGKIKLSTIKEGKKAVVSVEDTGLGIKYENIPKLFREFQQFETADHNRKTGGTGLGLAICKKIIEGHNGKIWATSEFGVGTTFCFQLPMEDVSCQIKY